MARTQKVLSEEVEKEVVKATNQGLRGAKQLHTLTATRSVEINEPNYQSPFKNFDFSGKKVIDILRNAVNTHLDFTGCDFTNADFRVRDNDTGEYTGMILQACKFNGCKMEGANMAYCDVRWSDFSHAEGLDDVIICAYDKDGTIIGGSAANTEGCTWQ